MKKGIVKFFNAKSKFGFIIEDGTDTELYVHIKDLAEPVQAGDRVLFNVKKEKRGMIAIEVMKDDQPSL